MSFLEEARTVKIVTNMSFHRGEQAFADGKPRVMPAEYLVDGGNLPPGKGLDQDRAKAWYRGWDAANLAASIYPPCDWLIQVRTNHPEPDFPSDMFTEVECGAPVHDSTELGVLTVCDNGHERFTSDEAGMVKLLEWEVTYDLETGDVF